MNITLKPAALFRDSAADVKSLLEDVPFPEASRRKCHFMMRSLTTLSTSAGSSFSYLCWISSISKVSISTPVFFLSDSPS